MKIQAVIAVFLSFCAALLSEPADAELAAANSHGVAMGHVHFKVRDIDSNLEFWTALGGKASKIGDTQFIHFPDIIIALTVGDYQGNSEGAVVNHVAFRVESLVNIEQAGLELEYFAGYPGVATVQTPEGEKIELFDEQATNLSFTVDDGEIDVVADRHNRKISVPITSHHIHLNVPEEDVMKAKHWYAELFGGVAGQRWHYEATDLPGINLNFSAATGPVATTRGRMVDHIGFEVENLEAFCQQLIENGITLDTPYTVHPAGFKHAFLTDPWGTYIELTEGMNNLQ